MHYFQDKALLVDNPSILVFNWQAAGLLLHTAPHFRIQQLLTNMYRRLFDLSIMPSGMHQADASSQLFLVRSHHDLIVIKTHP